MDTQAVPEAPPGLRRNHLSAIEAVGQSLATIAPTAGPAFIIPLVVLSSGNATWLVFLIATLATICIGREINFFARRYSSSGSLYSFVCIGLRQASIPTVWALLFAYLGTGMACVEGFVVYSHSLLAPRLSITRAEALGLSILGVAIAALLAWFDVKKSTRLLLALEALSLGAILLLFVLPGHASALQVDRAQLMLNGVTLHQVRGGVVLAVFAFVGFESAACFGAEAANPLRAIPRAIASTILACGLLFVVASYAETIIFAGNTGVIAGSAAPLRQLAELRGYPAFVPLLNVTTIISALAGLTACIQAAARTFYGMSRDGQCMRALGRAHSTRQSPHIGILASVAIILVLPCALTVAGSQPLVIYGWVATFSTFGFLTAYGAVTLAASRVRFRERTFGLVSALSTAIIACIIALGVTSSFDTAVTGIDRLIPYLYLVALALSTALTLLFRKAPSTIGRDGFLNLNQSESI